jgi:hypothetical protein
MAVIRSKPRLWFWSRDIEPDQVAGLAMPGMRLHVRFAVIAAA